MRKSTIQVGQNRRGGVLSGDQLSEFKLAEQNWDSAEEAAAMDNPLGGIKRGWLEIREVYSTLFQTSAKYHFEFWDYAT